MDGAVFDGDGPAFPLIGTKAKDLDGLRKNLKGSLTSYVQAGNTRRKAVVATRLSLSQDKRRGLERLAEEQSGFILVQIFQQEDLARQFYFNPDRARDVLGVSPKPSALSPFPKSQKPFPDVERVGRDGDFEWLQQSEDTDTDRLLIGEPGSGRTYLLRRYAEEVDGVWFLVDAMDREQISRALLEHRPRVVVVDDAEDQLTTLEWLRHRRTELTQLDRVSILAVTWAHAEKDVRCALGISEASTHRLPLMTRQEIVEVYQALGVEDTNERLSDLVTQAAHKPGLAETLAVLWHEGAWEKLSRGQGLEDALTPLLRRWVGEHATTTLAGFALGGESGMALGDVARGLDRPKPEILSEVSKLKALGILVRRDERLAVVPARLGHVLIADVFFTEAESLSWEDFVPADASPYWRVNLLETLLTSAHTQTKRLSRWKSLMEYLREWAQPEEWDPRFDPWVSFAALHHRYAEWALETYQGDRFKLAGRILWFQPRAALRILLAGDTDNDLQGVLEPWIRDVHAPRQEIWDRRQKLIQHAGSTLRRTPASPQAITALMVALDPNLEGSSTDPGEGRTVTLMTGLPGPAALDEIFTLWPEVRQRLQALAEWTPEIWRAVRRGFDAWLYPSMRDLDSETEESLNLYAREMMRGLAKMTQDVIGIQTNLRRRTARLTTPLKIETDPLFEFLHSDDYLTEGSPEHDAARNQAHALARSWSRDAPLDLAHKLEAYQQQVGFLDYEPEPQNLRLAMEDLAKRVEDSTPWLQALAGAKLHPWAIEPLIEALPDPVTREARQFLFSLLSNSSTAGPAAARLLRSEFLTPDELDRLLPEASRFSNLVYGMARRNELPAATVDRVLRSKEGDLAFEAALGLWEGASPIPSELEDDWTEVILTSKASPLFEHRLRTLLRAIPDLALRWLQRRAEDRNIWHEDRRVGLSLLETLSHEHRATLIDLLANHKFPDRAALRTLVGDDPDLYSGLVNHPHASDFTKAAPFDDRRPDEIWRKLVEVAKEAAVPPKDLADCMIHPTEMLVDLEKDYGGWEEALKPWTEDTDLYVREVAQSGLRFIGEKSAR